MRKRSSVTCRDDAAPASAEQQRSDAAPGPRAVGPSTHDGDQCAAGCAERVAHEGGGTPLSKIPAMCDWHARRLALWLAAPLCSGPDQAAGVTLAWHRSNDASRRLATIPGVGVITATGRDDRRWRTVPLDSFRPGSVWCPGSTRVTIDWDGYRSAGRLASAARAWRDRAALANVWTDWRGGRQTWCWSPWRQPVSPGPSGTSVSTDRRRIASWIKLRG